MKTGIQTLREDVERDEHVGQDADEENGILTQQEADMLEKEMWKDVQERGVFPRYDVYCFVGWKK